MSLIPGISQGKCNQRRRVAASRYQVEAVPLRFVGATAAETESDGFRVLSRKGELPATDGAALKIINSKLPTGAPALSLDEINIVYLEAANNNFVDDRSMHLMDSTLQNIATCAINGVSFMNSHQTGGISEPPTLPFGQTFSGAYQQGHVDGRLSLRSLVGVYMLRGIKPTGESGPSTDDLYNMLRSGTLKDVSVGLYGGWSSCEVCGNAIDYDNPDSWEDVTDDNGNVVARQRKCNHAPGTHLNMTEEEVKAQIKADPLNVKGYASYGYHDGIMHEVSAVYDGAVPGAGVRQVMALARDGELTADAVHEMLTEALERYGPLLPFDINEVLTIHERNDMELDANGNPITPGATPPATQPAPAAAPAVTPPVAAAVPPTGEAAANAAALESENATLRARLEAVEAAQRTQQEEAARVEAARLASQHTADLERFTSAIRPNVTPAAMPTIQALYRAAQSDTREIDLAGADGKTEKVTLSSLVERSFVALGVHLLLGKVPAPGEGDASIPVMSPENQEDENVARARQQARERHGKAGNGNK